MNALRGPETTTRQVHVPKIVTQTRPRAKSSFRNFRSMVWGIGPRMKGGTLDKDT